MAQNNLTPEQDLLTRKFFKLVQESKYLGSSPAHRRQLLAILLEALNYDQIGPNTFVQKGAALAVPFGRKAEEIYADEWEEDEERARAALGAVDSVEASPGESSESDAVGDVLQQDV